MSLVKAMKFGPVRPNLATYQLCQYEGIVNPSESQFLHLQNGTHKMTSPLLTQPPPVTSCLIWAYDFNFSMPPFQNKSIILPIL